MKNLEKIKNIRVSCPDLGVRGEGYFVFTVFGFLEDLFAVLWKSVKNLDKTKKQKNTKQKPRLCQLARLWEGGGGSLGDFEFVCCGFPLFSAFLWKTVKNLGNKQQETNKKDSISCLIWGDIIYLFWLF